MSIKMVLATAAFGLLSAGACLAQTPASPQASSDDSAYTYVPPAPPAAATPAPAKTGATVMVDGKPHPVVNADAAAKAGIPVQTITNGPVPDTVQNRAADGGPDSNAGAKTAPAGN